MNKNLKILVVPTEASNDIDQDSNVEEILKCDDTIIYQIGDVCQLLNNNDIMSDEHWFFFVDIKKKEHLNIN